MSKTTRTLLVVVLVGSFGVLAVMVLTAAIHLVAPYVALLTVLSFLLWFLSRWIQGEGGEPGQQDRPDD